MRLWIRAQYVCALGEYQIYDVLSSHLYFTLSCSSDLLQNVDSQIVDAVLK